MLNNLNEQIKWRKWRHWIFLLFIICFKFDLSYFLQRNSESDSVAHLLADYIFDSTASDARLVTHQDIVNFYKRVFEYDDYMADQISRRYIEWGDVNGDGALTKEGKHRSHTISLHYQPEFWIVFISILLYFFFYNCRTDNCDSKPLYIKPGTTEPPPIGFGCVHFCWWCQRMLFLSRDPCHRVLTASFKLFVLYFFANLKIASQDNAKESSFCSPQTTFAVVQLFPFRTEWNTRLYEANLDCLDDFRKKHIDISN